MINVNRYLLVGGFKLVTFVSLQSLFFFQTTKLSDALMLIFRDWFGGKGLGLRSVLLSRSLTPIGPLVSERQDRSFEFLKTNIISQLSIPCYAAHP